MRGVNRAYGDDSGNREDMYKFRDTDFSKIAQEMGCFGVRVQRPEDLRGALKKALEAEEAAVVDVSPTPNTMLPGRHRRFVSPVRNSSRGLFSKGLNKVAFSP
jgi:acetolactate synthase-1/2/3 large subunit